MTLPVDKMDRVARLELEWLDSPEVPPVTLAEAGLVSFVQVAASAREPVSHHGR